MQVKTLSQKALKVINDYSNFTIGNASCSVPYFNNKKIKNRAGLRAQVGKGRPQEIREELEIILKKNKIDLEQISNENLKKILVDNNIGIECSGFVFHVLDAEAQSRNLGSIARKIHFINCHGIIGQIRCAIRPIENCDVSTFANDKNSIRVKIQDIRPGDIVTMMGNGADDMRNHILIIKEVEYENNIPKSFSYAHAIAYPEDGIYGSGIRQGKIILSDLSADLDSQQWLPENNTSTNLLKNYKNKYKIEIRRPRFLSWLQSPRFS